MNHKNSVNFQEVALDVIVSSVAGLQSIKNELILQMLKLQLPISLSHQVINSHGINYTV